MSPLDFADTVSVDTLLTDLFAVTPEAIGRLVQLHPERDQRAQQGRRTQYRHLAKILIKEGQLVTPSTPIGQLGNSSIAPCKINYTHFEYLINAKKGSPNGTKVDPGPMRACVDGKATMFPQALNNGNPNWNAMPGEARHRLTAQSANPC